MFSTLLDLSSALGTTTIWSYSLAAASILVVLLSCSGIALVHAKYFAVIKPKSGGVGGDVGGGGLDPVASVLEETVGYTDTFMLGVVDFMFQYPLFEVVLSSMWYGVLLMLLWYYFSARLIIKK